MYSGLVSTSCIGPKVQGSKWYVCFKNHRTTAKTRHQRCRRLDGTLHIHSKVSKLQLIYLSIQQLESNSYTIRSQSVLTIIQLGVSTMFSTARAY